MSLLIFSVFLVKGLGWGALIVFGYWMYRKFDFRSYPWLVVYLVLVPALTWGGNMAMLEWVNRQVYPSGLSGFNLAQMTYWFEFFSGLALIVLLGLILADIFVLLKKVDIEVNASRWNRLLIFYNHSVIWGVLVMALKIVPFVAFHTYLRLASHL